MKETAVVSITGLLFLIVGIFCLFFPERIQEYVINLHSGAKGLVKFNPLFNWMKTSWYLLSLRIIGTMAIIGFILTLFVILSEIRRFHS